MPNHDKHHDHCEHELKFCQPCDVAYCAKCSKEWDGPCQQPHYWYYPTYPGTGTGTPTYPTWTTTSAPATHTSTAVDHAHA